MPDLKSELFKVIPHMKAEQTLDNLKFDDDDQQTESSQSEGSSKLTNESLVAYIESHPAATFQAMRVHFPDHTSGLGARLKQLTDRGIFERVTVDGVYHYKRSALPFTPMSTEDRIAAMNAARLAKGSKPKAPKSRKVKLKTKGKTVTMLVPEAVLKKVGTRPAAPAPVKAQWDVDTIIDSLGLKQARALFEELKKYFG